MLANHVYAQLLLLLQPSLLWLSIVTFNNYVKPPGAKVNFARIWCITNPTPTSLGYITLKRWRGKIWPQLRRLPGEADRTTHLEGSPHLTCKRDQIEMRDYMDRRVTPPKWVTMPTCGPPPPCKQALSLRNRQTGNKRYTLPGTNCDTTSTFKNVSIAAKGAIISV